MIRQIAYAGVLATSAMLAGQPVMAQDQGARAGNSYLPSTHTKGCGGFLCDADDPRRAVGAPPPPPCEGLLCSLSPYAMGRPVTTAEAQRIQEQNARPAAVAAPEPVEPVSPKRSARHRKAKATKAKSVAARTPDPSPAAPQAPR